jgi:hypothetical protein
MKKTIFTLILSSMTLFGSAIAEKAPVNPIVLNEPQTHRFYFYTGISSSLYESAPPLLLLGVSYNYYNGDDFLFTGTNLSIDLGCTPVEESINNTILEKHSQLKVTGRIMGVIATSISNTTKYFLSLGTHCSLSSYQKYSVKLKISNPEDLDVYIATKQTLDSLKTYIGPSIITGVEILTPGTNVRSAVFFVGYDHPFICSKGAAPKIGNFYIGCGGRF